LKTKSDLSTERLRIMIKRQGDLWSEGLSIAEMFEKQKPLGAWLEDQTDESKISELPEGEPRLPDASNFFEATTVYFGKKPAISHVCSSRAEAELVYAISRAGLRGAVSIPASETECSRVLKALESRFREGRKRMEEMAEQLAGTDKLREQIATVLHRWFIIGKKN